MHYDWQSMQYGWPRRRTHSLGSTIIGQKRRRWTPALMGGKAASKRRAKGWQNNPALVGRGRPPDVRFQELRARKDSLLIIKGAGWGCEPCMAGGGALRRQLIKL